VAVALVHVPAAGGVGTEFTYQGQLQQNGTAVTGTCDLQFALFDEEADGTQVGPALPFNGVQVTNGLFTLQLDFGAVFDGSDLWLQIANRCPAGSGDFTTLAPRQPITATPYALSLHLPTESSAASADDALLITNSGTGPAGHFVKPFSLNPASPTLIVEAGGFGGIAISAEASAPTGGGVLGVTVGTFRAGVEGRSTAAAGGTGVEGEATGTNGVGVHAEALLGTTAKAVSARSTEGHAGYFDGRVRVIAASSDLPDPFVVGVNGDNEARIDAMGKGFFNGGTQMGGADVAEFVLTTDAPGPGDVVEIDPERPGHFRRAASAYSTAVAGVISTEPGVSLNARDGAAAAVEGPQLALVGRVPVKVTDANGAIRPGDLLVASSVPGHAMRSAENPAAGTVIGKALGSHTAGDGIVEMLVMLR
jgi:hypothetical protein